jgi:hypothetical protein
MQRDSHPGFEEGLRRAAAAFPYPPTPDLAAAVSRRLAAQRRPRPAAWGILGSRLAWAVIVLALVAGLLLSVPQVRAALAEFFQIGAIRIFPADPTAAVQGTPAITATPRPTMPALTGETTPERAAAALGAPLNLPEYPEGLGAPDRVYLQYVGGPQAILVWDEPGRPEEVRLALHALRLEEGALGGKFQVREVEETAVAGRPAYWVVGEHMLEYRDAAGRTLFRPARLVAGNVLIWEAEGITYRLETSLPLEEAVRIAESIPARER